jgi:hypothetical protein
MTELERDLIAAKAGVLKALARPSRLAMDTVNGSVDGAASCGDEGCSYGFDA